MDDLAPNVLSLFEYLLPGFLAAWIFYGLTSFPLPSQFERVIQALIFTLIIQSCVYGIEALFLRVGESWSLGVWDAQLGTFFSVILAVLLGILFSYFANSDKFHSLMRKAGVTKETSYPSEWFGEFSKKVTFVILHLTDERRIYGWPVEWPTSPQKGHFSVAQAAWIDNNNEEIPLTNLDSILIAASDVKWVEFMQSNWEQTNGQESIKSATASSDTS